MGAIVGHPSSHLDGIIFMREIGFGFAQYSFTESFVHFVGLHMHRLTSNLNKYISNVRGEREREREREE